MSDTFAKVEDAEDKVCSILDLFCEIQEDICKKLEKRDEDDEDSMAISQHEDSPKNGNLH